MKRRCRWSNACAKGLVSGPLLLIPHQARKWPKQFSLLAQKFAWTPRRSDTASDLARQCWVHLGSRYYYHAKWSFEIVTEMKAFDKLLLRLSLTWLWLGVRVKVYNKALAGNTSHGSDERCSTAIPIWKLEPFPCFQNRSTAVAQAPRTTKVRCLKKSFVSHQLPNDVLTLRSAMHKILSKENLEF